jgi:UDP-N-acetylglucosamine transferase subunit ALG13
MFPFDRLVQAIDEMVGRQQIAETVVAQIGDGRYEPRHMAFDRYLAKPDYDRRFAEATMLIAHAGAGTIALALQHHKPLLVVPRLGRFKEHVNDHQVVTARKYGELGHVLVAADVGEIADRLAALRTFQPRSREVRPRELALRIGEFLQTIRPRGRAG